MAKKPNKANKKNYTSISDALQVSTIAKSKHTPNAISRAYDALQKAQQGVLSVRKSNKHHYPTIAIGMEYRLLYRRSEWLLLSHNEYTRMIDRD